MQYDHIGSLFLSFGSVGSFQSFKWRQLRKSYAIAKDKVMRPRWGAFN